MVPVSHHFVMRSGPTPGKTFQLTGQEITIGRDPSNDIPPACTLAGTSR